MKTCIYATLFFLCASFTVYGQESKIEKMTAFIELDDEVSLYHAKLIQKLFEDINNAPDSMQAHTGHHTAGIKRHTKDSLFLYLFTKTITDGSSVLFVFEYKAIKKPIMQYTPSKIIRFEYFEKYNLAQIITIAENTTDTVFTDNPLPMTKKFLEAVNYVSNVVKK